MSVELQSRERTELIFADLKDGQLAEIVEDSQYKGLVVQRVGDKVQVIGRVVGMSWNLNAVIQVRLLLPGDTIVVKEN